MDHSYNHFAEFTEELVDSEFKVRDALESAFDEYNKDVQAIIAKNVIAGIHEYMEYSLHSLDYDCKTLSHYSFEMPDLNFKNEKRYCTKFDLLDIFECEIEIHGDKGYFLENLELKLLQVLDMIERKKIERDAVNV